ncbi:MAG: hypothetical protein CXT72_03530 [Methanobacteriota archaeon]|jgi:hypothetical protein|nr:MAG: hypothetical protein CXT72_03530 [Euryarchaeota archaeon]HIE63611.1 hypothetical protein [Candidatus Poseidoniales archaeon]HIK99391.1 hypothetical protein [Candidatus Poseidoniales archaeon]
MRSVSTTIFIVIIIASAAPLVTADAKGTIFCTNADLDMMPANWEITDQSCVRIHLGELNPGTTLSMDIATDSAIDILLFTSNAINTYQNEQNYRSETIWESESVFELFSGEGVWHWTVPDDRPMTHWYLVLDNLAHPQDGGEGGQGGSATNVTMDIFEVVSPAFLIVDTIVRLDINDHEFVAGPFMLDAGTQISIQAETMEGAPDIFLMTETQMQAYEQAASEGGTAASRINPADLLAVTSTGSTVWTVSIQYEGVALYLLADNRAGGGGAGTNIVASTIISSLTPILDPILSDAASLDIVDIGTLVVLDAGSTPNFSNQILRFGWDTNADGIDDTVGSMINVSWSEPTNISIRLTAVSTDLRSVSIYKEIEVKDISAPLANIDVNAEIRRSFGETLVLSGDFSDNWGVAKVEWLVDGEIIESYESDFSNADRFTHIFDASYDAGNHDIILRVTDLSGMVTVDNAPLDLYDSTPPVISQTQVTTLKLIAGQSHDFSVNVSDEESGNLIYAWDFDEDGISDGTGSSIIHSFDTKGSAWVRCTITNDAGLETQVDIQIQVISDGGETSSMSIVMIAGITTGVIGLLALICFTIWRTLENRRISVLLAAAEAEELASKDVVQPSVNEQKAMWGGADSTQADAFNQITQQSQLGGLSSGMSGLPIPPSSGQATHGAQIPVAEMDPDLAELISASPPPTNDARSSSAHNLLAAFEEDDAVPREEVEVNFDDDSVPLSEGIWQPPVSEELDLPSPPLEVAEDTIPIPVPPIDTIVEKTIEKETESSPPIETETTDVLDAEQTPETEDENRTVRQSCSSCEKTFEVDMPKGVNAARTACPHCESVETVRLE